MKTSENYPLEESNQSQVTKDAMELLAKINGYEANDEFVLHALRLLAKTHVERQQETTFKDIVPISTQYEQKRGSNYVQVSVVLCIPNSRLKEIHN